MTVFHSAKRIGQYHHWEPIYIGTHVDPHYEERLNWEGKSDKMTQGYALCVLDYNFKILSNAFLIHKPGIKTIGEARRPKLEMATTNLIKKQLLPELKIMYGLRKGCTW
jgi:beta-1,4-glucuronyltransferase 1